MGFLDGLFGGGSSAPRAPDPVKLDAGAQGLLDASAKRAQASPEDFAARTSGENEARGMLQNDTQFGQEQSRGAESNPFGQAIRGAYQEKANYGMNRIKKINNLSAQMQKSKELQDAAKAALGQQNAMTQQMQFLTNAYNQQESARAGFINSLFQTVNTGIGMGMGSMKGGDNTMGIKGAKGVQMGGMGGDEGVNYNYSGSTDNIS